MKRVQKLTLFAMLCALAIVFHYVESMVVIPLPVPGFRLGLANILSLIALYYFDARALFTIGIVRCAVCLAACPACCSRLGFWLYRWPASLLTALAMTIARRCSCFSIYGVSVLGSAAHCVAQVMVVTWIYQQFFMQALLPILVALSIPTGLLIAMLADLVLKRLP